MERSRLESRCEEESNLGRRLDKLSVQEIDLPVATPKPANKVCVKGLCVLHRCKSIHAKKENSSTGNKKKDQREPQRRDPFLLDG